VGRTEKGGKIDPTFQSNNKNADTESGYVLEILDNERNSSACSFVVNGNFILFFWVNSNYIFLFFLGEHEFWKKINSMWFLSLQK
jgi:hypothetical protein